LATAPVGRRDPVRSSLRNRLLAAFVVVGVLVGTGTLVAIERTLADDLVTSLDARLTRQGEAVAGWLTLAGHPDRLAPRLAAVTGARLTIVGADGLVQGDSLEPSAVGRPVGDAPEIASVHRGERGRAIRRLGDGDRQQYLVAVPADLGRVIRLAVPLDDVLATRARMRNRLLVGAALGFVALLLLSWLFIRALVRPLQAMTRTAERLARGEYEVPTPPDAGGELGVLGHALSHMAREVKARVGELTAQRDLLSVVIGGLVEGVVVVDAAGAVVVVNDAARPLVGDGALPEEVGPLLARALAGEVADGELRLRGREVRASARPLLPGALLVLYDVTQLHALEAVRREFLADAAHELRTPVTSISGYAETLLAGDVDAATSREFLQTIHRNAARLTALVADLLVLDQLDARPTVVAARRALALGPAIEDALRTVRGVRATARLTAEVPADLAVLATRDGLDHIVQNLVDNAVTYGGDTEVTVRARREGAKVRVEVEDRGAGVPAAERERIFERFHRLDAGRSRAAGGSGLGLAIVASQVAALGGRVWVEDAAPGARFVVELDAPTG
jgi:two-component system phosphate regulon sensor histidine kinase PhoR